MKGEFIISLNGVLITYTEYDDIPMVFDHLIKYAPWYPYYEDGRDHTDEEHDYLDTLDGFLKELMSRETK